MRDALGRGAYMAAFDEAPHGLEREPDSVELRYLSVLALARAGANAQVMNRFAELRLEECCVGGRPHRASRRSFSLGGVREGSCLR